MPFPDVPGALMVAPASIVQDIFRAALVAVDPFTAVERNLEHIQALLHAGSFKKLMVIGFGKASCPMARACEQYLDDRIDSGAVVTKYGHSRVPSPLKKIRVYEAAHPLPDENGVAAAQEIIKLAGEADEETLVVCLISGGGSALLVAPREGITLPEKQEVTNLLLRSGATITELNAVRKHLSRVKGGQLAKIAYPAPIISLIVSDVIGDGLDVIASGPTAPDASTYEDAYKVFEKYRLLERVPKSVLSLLEKGMRGATPETPKQGDKLFKNVQNRIIASNRTALLAAKEKAEQLGFHADIISSTLEGEARDVARSLASRAKAANPSRPSCLISGGETTVTVKGTGLGGRNTELALAFALEIDGNDKLTLLSAGTDGTDGPTDAAGAVVDGRTISRARALGLDPRAYLENNDSYTFFQKTNDLLITGPTGTNVMDIQVIIGA